MSYSLQDDRYGRTLLGFLTLSAILFSFLLVPHAQATTTGTTTATSTTPLFTKDLRLGTTDEDVKRLQQFLNAHGFALGNSGVGSPGQETTYFGLKTRSALALFQQHFAADILTPLGLTRGTGNFFIATRTFINKQLLAESKPAPQTVVPVVRYSGGNSRRSSATYTVTPSGTGAVSISPSGAQTVSSKGTKSFTVTASEGYTVSDTVGGTCPVGSWSGSVYTTGSITQSCTVSFSAPVNTYTVTLSGSGITPSGDHTVTHGSTQSFTVDSGVGYGLGTIGGTCPSGSWVHATYTTGAITSSCSVTFTPSVSGVGIGSSVSGDATIYMRQNAGNIEYSNDGTSWTSLSLPTINNIGAGTLTVELVGDFTLSSADAYIIANSDNITIQGAGGSENPTIITISDVSDYPGFIQNGSAFSNGYNNVTVSDIFVNAYNSTLADNAGWLGQQYFGKGVTGSTFTDCGSNGAISSGSGGVVGANAEQLTLSKCFATGAIGAGAGGIVGSFADSVVVQNSYSSGAIGDAAGGIFGASAANSLASNTYAVGTIGLLAGGIFGDLHSSPTVLHSYTSGLSAGGVTGGILAGSATDGVSNYSEANNSGFLWNDSHAVMVLTGIDAIWKSIGTNEPYKLLAFSASPYADSTQTITAGQSSTAVYGYYNSCSILSISGGSAGSYADIAIDSDTGVVSTTALVEAGTYSLLVHCSTLHGTYTTSSLELTVN